MPDFEIYWKNDTTYHDGICLGFTGKMGERLYIKDIVFLPEKCAKADEYKVALCFVLLESTEILRHFEFPNPKTPYKAMRFHVRQEGVKGWLVTVDFHTHYVDIQETEYQIL